MGFAQGRFGVEMRGEERVSFVICMARKDAKGQAMTRQDGTGSMIRPAIPRANLTLLTRLPNKLTDSYEGRQGVVDLVPLNQGQGAAHEGTDDDQRTTGGPSGDAGEEGSEEDRE